MPFASTMRDVPPRRRFRPWRRIILLAFVALWVAVAFWQTNKPLPPGVHVESPWYPVAERDLAFIADITSADAYGRPVISQAIFDEVLGVVRSARKFIVLDYFLFNSLSGSPPDAGPGPAPRQISAELRDALIERRREQPDLQVLFVTDPINDVYGSSRSQDLRLLRAAGVHVAVTDLRGLRDSNFIYSSLWRLGVAWWSGDGRDTIDSSAGWLPNPFGDDDAPITLGAWARLANFKANQRKVVIADDGHGGLVGIVGSANPDDASSAHSNVALKVAGPVLIPLLRSELNIARFSGWNGHLSAAETSEEPPPTSAKTRAKVLTEGAIRAALLEHLDAAVRGDNVDIAAFYIADRGVVESLLAASRRGVAVRLILDPNKDTFGHDEGGIPNRPVASELVAASDGAIHVRWYRTHSEQFHTKLVMIYGSETVWLAVGSADLTRRSLGDYNLEADVALEIDRDSPLAQQTLTYFETLWSNRALLGIEYTADFGYYADPSQLLYWTYRVMEGTGISTF
jgi:phosphatidylserine/phosphatidylglycerophosphate/cardiolipin synthase-like enzyme